MDKNKLKESLPSRNDAVGEHARMTRDSGAPVINNQDTMTAGPPNAGDQDVWLLEKHAHFNREVIPEDACMRRDPGALWRIHRDS